MQARYVQIAEELRGRIADGRYPLGTSTSLKTFIALGTPDFSTL